MSWLDGLRDRLHWLFRSTDAEERLDSELQFHLEMETERLIASGLSPDDAAREAARSLGNLGRTKETVRDERGISWLEDLGRDLAYAARGLRRRPGFTFAVLATLALGIGANTAVFSVVEGVALRPLAFDDPSRLVAVWDDRSMSQAERKAMIEQTRTLASLAGYATWNMAYTGVDQPTQLRAARTSGNLFEVLGARAALGRTYHAGEDAVGAEPLAVLSHALWMERYHGDSTVLGRPIELDGVRYTIVGVMPRTFEVARTRPRSGSLFLTILTRGSIGPASPCSSAGSLPGSPSRRRARISPASSAWSGSNSACPIPTARTRRWWTSASTCSATTGCCSTCCSAR